MRSFGILALIALFIGACGSSDSVKVERTEEGDRAQLAATRQDIEALVGKAACGALEDCRFAGLGAKPCGGPWEYIIYSVADSAALAKPLAVYTAFEADMNQRYEYASDCSEPNEPMLACSAGRCIDLLQGGTVSIRSDQVDEPTPVDPGRPRFAMDMAVAGDAFTLQEARVEGDIVALVVGYSGGCEAHEFTLLASLAASKSIPPQHMLKLVHEGNGDACEAFITSELRFDLTVFRELYPGLEGVAFRLEGVEDLLQYTF